MRPLVFLLTLGFAACNSANDPESRNGNGSVGGNENENTNGNGNGNGSGNQNTNGNTNSNDDTPVGSVSVGVNDTVLTPEIATAGTFTTVTIQARAGAMDATLSGVDVRVTNLFIIPRPMSDDGLSPDTVAGDGLFTAQFSLNGSETPGAYEVIVTARGTDINGVGVTGERALTLLVAAGYDVNAGTGGGLTSIAGNGDATSFGSAVHSITTPFDLEFYGRTLSAGSDAALSDDGHLTFNGRAGYVNAGTATAALSVQDGAPGIAVHNASTFFSTIYSLVSGEAPNRTWTLEWTGTYLGGGSGEFQLRFTEGTAGFVIHYGQMEPVGNPDWAIVAVDSAGAFNQVVTADNRPELTVLSQTQWVFSAR